MKKVLLFGSGGIIGRFLSKELSSDFLITKISRQYTSNKVDYSMDLLDIEEINNFVKKIDEFDCIVYLVGLAHKSEWKNTLSDYRNINLITLKNLLFVLEKHRKVPKKIIFASTVSVYGDNIDKTHYSENNSALPKTFYSSTKLQAENFLKENYARQSWILRFAPVYSKDILFNINKRIKFLNLPFKVGGGLSKFSLCSINNIKLIVDSIINDKIPSGIYNISDSIDYNYKFLHDHNNSNFIISVPLFFIKIIYFTSKVFGISRIEELSIKLISDNLYPSKKINKFVKLTHYIGS